MPIWWRCVSSSRAREQPGGHRRGTPRGPARRARGLVRVHAAVGHRLIAFAIAFGMDIPGAGWLHGLKVVAVAVVAQAVWGWPGRLSRPRRATMAIVAAMAVSAWPTAGDRCRDHIAGVVGCNCFPDRKRRDAPRIRVPIGRPLGVAALAVFFALLVSLPALRYLTPSHPLAVFDSFYRAGSLVFGGGHVVLPLLQAEVVPPGWVSNEHSSPDTGSPGRAGAALHLRGVSGSRHAAQPERLGRRAFALMAIFLPSFLLVVGALPFWDALRARAPFQAALRGINAGVVGLLLAALYHPVWTSAIHAPSDFTLALAAFGLLSLWRVPPWLVVAFAAAGGSAIAAFR